MSVRFDIVTLFPRFFDGPFQFGILARAVESGLVDIHTCNLREFTGDRHQTVDDRPFGGGEGMVLKPGPIFQAVESLGTAEKNVRDTRQERVVLLSAQGKPFSQAMAREFAALDRMVLICGRYEGVDERVNELLADTELSIGDYVISGGELAAAIVVDAVSRLVPGVLGNEDSARYESFSGPDLDPAGGGTGPQSTCDSGGLLDYPHYTRPAEFRGASVPAVLSSGNHDEIRRWRHRQSLRKTLENRPGLLSHVTLSKEDEKVLAQLRADKAH